MNDNFVNDLIEFTKKMPIPTTHLTKIIGLKPINRILNEEEKRIYNESLDNMVPSEFVEIYKDK